MTGVYEKQCKGARFDYMVSTVNKCRELVKQKNYKESYSKICELLLSLCNDRELVEEFFYSGAFELCCEFLTIKGENDMKRSKEASDYQDIEIPSLIIEQFSLLSSFTLQSFDEEIGEISLLIFFLAERHRYYVDVNWKSRELRYMGIFLHSHFQFLYSAIKFYSDFERDEGPSLLLLTLKNIEVAIRGFPAHRIVPNMAKVLTENLTWELIELVSEMIISNTIELISELKGKTLTNHTRVLSQFRECAQTLIQIITYLPTIGTSSGINKLISPSLTQIGLQKLLLTQNNGIVGNRCSCKYCENCRKIQKVCTQRDELIIKETAPFLRELIEVFIRNNALDILSNLITCIQNIDNNCLINNITPNNYFSYQKTFVNMMPFIQKSLDTDLLNKSIVILMQIMPKLTKINENSNSESSIESILSCFKKVSISEPTELNPVKIKIGNMNNIEIVTLSDQAKSIVHCLSSIILHSLHYPLKNTGNVQLSGALEIVCPTFELLLRKYIVEWEKYSEIIFGIKFTSDQLVIIMSEVSTLLALIIPVYIKYLKQKSSNSIKGSQKSTFQFIQKGLSNILSVFSEFFLTLSQMFITDSKLDKLSSENVNKLVRSQIPQEKRDTIYSIGTTLISCLSIVSDVSTYSWTCISRRRYLPSPHYKICGWISSNQYKFTDLWKQIFTSERCIFVKELSQIITIISERSSALNSKYLIFNDSKKTSELDQIETTIEDTDEEVIGFSNENANYNFENVE
ncbi:Armadillo-type fold containing protein [Cryptosporidium felis]|nr:Armadillo-type fold containing protein [Cryptosporidium felis]